MFFEEKIQTKEFWCSFLGMSFSKNIFQNQNLAFFFEAVIFRWFFSEIKFKVKNYVKLKRCEILETISIIFLEQGIMEYILKQYLIKDEKIWWKMWNTEGLLKILW